jgi:hypothetical protein
MNRWFKILASFGIFVLLWGVPACNHVSQKDRRELKTLAAELNSLFVHVRKDLETLKIAVEQVLSDPEGQPGLYDEKRYRYTKNHVYYTPEDDGHCEVWASGHMPIGASEKKRIRAIEHLCPDFEAVYKKNGFIDNIYLTTYDSIVMNYPYADMQAYMKSGLDLTKVWVTYRAADEKENPERRTLWVPPYVDAVGRGYMTSVIMPVYRGDFLEGTLGIDITADLISDTSISLSPKNLMIVTASTIPVAMNKNSRRLLNLKGLEKYYYFQKEAENKAISPSLMMTQSSSEEIRAIADWVKGFEKEGVFKISGVPYHFLKEDIPEVGWFLIEMVEK